MSDAPHFLCDHHVVLEIGFPRLVSWPSRLDEAGVLPERRASE
ncbi:hypothetical protein [Enhygromyxa salina]|nr:hypothetical protein [Enhygromyxa salina]